MRLLGVVATVVVLLPATALAQVERDRGSSRTTFRERGIALETYTSQDGDLRCLAVAGQISSCSPPQLREGALLIGHKVNDGVLGPLVVGGLAGEAATSVSLRWSGGAKTVRTRRFGAFLFVLPSTVRQRTVVITMRHRGGGHNTVDYRRTRARMTPVAGSERLDQTVADPLEDRDLGLLTWLTRQGESCSFLGDAVGGRVGALRGQWFTEYPVNDGGACVRRDATPEPLAVSIGQQDGVGDLTGFVRPDVTGVEVRVGAGPPTPLRISARGAFATVFRAPATLTLTAILRDGTRVEKVMSTAPPVAPPAPAAQASRP